MNAEQRALWAQSEIIKAMQEGLRGSITFHFDNGLLVSRQKVGNDKPDIDQGKK